MKSLVGQTLKNRYLVQEHLGRGGMAEVYKVWDNHRSTMLAVKVMHEDLAVDKVFMRRFRREADTLARLQHPNIVRFYGLEEEGRLVYMLLDYIEGDNLKLKIFDAAGPYPTAGVLQVMQGVCQALAYAHKEGLIHNDIKPGNIMINQHGQVLLADFGIARLADAATATMVGVGTPAYMAPEQVKGLDPVPQTDIYALGIVLYEMLTGGERPFTGEQATRTGTTSFKVRWEQINLDPPSPSGYNPDISPALESVVMKCLAKDPNQRYQTALYLLNALERAIGFIEDPESQSAAAVLTGKTAPTSAQDRGQKEQQNLRQDHPQVGYLTPASLQEPKSLNWWQRNRGWLGVGGILVAAMTVMLTKGGGSGKQPLAVPTKTLPPSPSTTFPSTLTETPALPTIKMDDFGIPMMLIPAGEFEMGMDADRALVECQKYSEPNNDSECELSSFENEEPVHEVYLDVYYIDQYEVTNAAYQDCVEAGTCDPPEEFISNTRDSYYGNSAYDEYPVVNVNWEDANTYCEWRGGRLPTEAEWEKAARGTDGRMYPWGDEFDGAVVNFCDQECEFDHANTEYNDGYAGTAPVGSYPGGASPYGVMDMAGNVWEWVSDWSGGDYYANSPAENPLGPTSGENRRLRGGGWWLPANYVSAAYRLRDNPDLSNNSTGFRCAASPE